MSTNKNTIEEIKEEFEEYLIPEFQFSSRRQKYGDPYKMINRLDSKNFPYKLRLGSECTEILFYDTLFVFTSTKNFPRKKLFLFNLVKKDVQKFIKKYGNVELPVNYSSTYYNLNYEHERSIGIDLNHAYWRIAYVKGLISQKTYDYGLHPECKALRLATLSVLGREKKFVDKNVENPKEYIVQEFSKPLNDVFKYIRLVCFSMMNSLANKLGPDFDCWRTDCIYFHDTPINRKVVTDYFDKKNMPYKILDYFE